MTARAAAIGALLALAAARFAFTAEAQVTLQGPITINRCRTIDQPGSYRLATNLTALGNCLVITSQGVTIDLNGFTIVGNGTGTAILGPRKAAGIPQARTVVRNGDISNFAQATNLSGTVEHLRVISNASGIVVGLGTVRDNIVQSNAATGIQLADGIVSGNLLVANGIGILVQEAGVLTNNQAAGNKIGIRVACPSNLSNNTAIGNPSNLVRTGTGCRDGGNLFGP